MKKTAVGAASLVMALLLASCASSTVKQKIEGKRVSIPESLKETGMEAVENADTAIISFDANATTGYSWEYTLDGNGVVEEESSSYITDGHTEGIVGYGGRQQYIFTGIREGQTTATFCYRRPWDSSSGIYTVTVTFKVGRGNKLTIVDIR